MALESISVALKISKRNRLNHSFVLGNFLNHLSWDNHNQSDSLGYENGWFAISISISLLCIYSSFQFKVNLYLGITLSVWNLKKKNAEEKKQNPQHNEPLEVWANSRLVDSTVEEML